MAIKRLILLATVRVLPTRTIWCKAGVELRPFGLRDPGEIERSLAAFSRESSGGLIVTAVADWLAFTAI